MQYSIFAQKGRRSDGTTQRLIMRLYQQYVCGEANADFFPLILRKFLMVIKNSQVLNGDVFEQRFNDLRRKRDRDDDAGARPFSRMHKYYVLLAGNRWAKVRFRTKLQEIKI